MSKHSARAFDLFRGGPARSTLLAIFALLGAWSSSEGRARAADPPAAGEPAGAATVRRALLVGIDTYSAFRPRAGESPPDRLWGDLDGAVRDVEGIRSLLTLKFGFPAESITTLTDKAATREAILGGLEALAAASGPGDVVLFYYAGHGSQVRNSLATDEPDGMDESLVPADSRAGAADIRDDELNDAFGKIIDKGARLTIILDSCHSGSGTRGLGRARSVAADPKDVAQPPSTSVPAEKRGAVVMSAAQDFQLAWEAKDEEGKAHGLFSLSLTRALQQMAPGESVEQLFQRVRTMMQAAGTYQEPVLAGLTERTHTPLFGTRSRGDAALTVPGRLEKDGRVRLGGGVAIGLHPGSELVRVGAAGSPKVRIKTLPGAELAVSYAEVVEGEAKSLNAAGDLFEVVLWATAPGPALTVYVPTDGPPLAALLGLARELGKLPQPGKLDVLADPLAGQRTHLVYFEGGAWWLLGPSAGRGPVALGASLKASAIQRQVARDPGPGGRSLVYVALPPPRELASDLAIGKRGFDNVVVVPKLADAQYALSARLAGVGSAVEAAWVTRDHFADPSTQAPLPPATDWVTVSSAEDARRAAGELDGQAATLVRIRSWLTLANPGDGGDYPYALAFRKPGSDELVTPDSFKAGEVYELVMHRDKAAAAIPSRYVYVLLIDSSGAGTLLFPAVGQGNVENYLPRPKEAAPEVMKLTSIKILPPFGLDTYILLTTNEPLLALSQVGWDGVMSRTRGGSPGAVSPLEALLTQTGGRTRGAGSVAPSGWAVQRQSVLSTAR